MTNEPVFLVIDTETGGLDADKHSLLSLAGVLWYPRKAIAPLFNMGIREDTLCILKEAIAINKIDLTNLVITGTSPEQSVTLIKHLLDTTLGTDRQPISLAGHNVEFDIRFLKRLYKMAKADFSKDFSHRSFDSASLLHFLQLVNEIPQGKINSDVLFKVCNVEIPEEQRHTALGDALATAKSLDYLVKLYYNPENKFDLPIETEKKNEEKSKTTSNN